MMQPPHDIHGPAALMADIIRCAEECVRCSAAGILLEFTDEQQHLSIVFLMMDIPLAGRRIGIRRGLALPMEQAGADCVIIVQRCGRIVLICLIERDQQDIRFLVLEILHALTQRLGLEEIQSHKKLIAAIAAMNVQRAIIQRG